MIGTRILKSVAAVAFAGVIFAGPAAAESAKPFFEKNIERWGADYSVFEVESGGVNACYNACAKDKACQAWTYNRPGTQSKNGVCHLKSQVSHPKPNECCVSGILVGQSAVPSGRFSPVAYGGEAFEERKAQKAERSRKSRPAQRFFRTASVSEAEDAGLPEMKAAAYAPPTDITPLSFSEEF